jgi:hypothetical protein
MPLIANKKSAAVRSQKAAAGGKKKTAAAGGKKKTAAAGGKKAVASKAVGARRRLQLGGGDCGGPVMLDPVLGVPYSVGNVLPNYAAAPSLTLLKSPIAYIDGATMGARQDYVVFPPISSSSIPAGDLNTQGGDFNLPLVVAPGATGGGLRKKRTTAPKRKPTTAAKNKKTAPKATKRAK